VDNLTTSLRLSLLTVVTCSVLYPAAILGFAAATVPEKRQGSLIRNEAGDVVGSRLLAQEFTRPGYFWPRPSAADYNAAGAGGSNLSPANPKLAERAAAIVARLNPPSQQRVPADLLAESGSGLDPHITLAAAMLQAPRIAQARGLSEETVRDLVRRLADSPSPAAVGGWSLVNVLELNLALDRLAE
jgi:K+-transporting ATPase ATPase C chain